MKLHFLAIFSFATFLVNGQVKELKQAQDTRKQYIGQDTAPLQRRFAKVNYVNPFIGTGGHGHTYPGASAPFGMMQLSPDTRYEGWDGASGYHYSDSIIYGFSHTHLSGTGVSDYCDLLIVPQSGKAKTEPGYLTKDGYGSKFSHDNENARPGYYRVHLIDENIEVQLTTTKRSGIHEYTFKNENEKKYILIDLDHRDKLLSSSFNIINDSTISGSRISSSWASKQDFFFYINTDTPFSKSELIEKDGKHKLLLTFPKDIKKIMLKVGISSVDKMGAEKNLTTEIPNWNFTSIKLQTSREWEKELNKIYFYTPDKDVMINFYTAFYHSMLNPNLFTDVDGRYRGMDSRIYTLSPGESNMYTVFSLWDTYRATHPLLTLTHPNKTNEFIHTFLRQYKQSGCLPVWELAGNETNCMIGYHSVSVMADAYLKGINGFNEDEAIEAIIESLSIDKFGKLEFINKGYISSGDEPESVSKTLEYAYDNFCFYQLVSEYAKKNPDPKLTQLLGVIENTMYNFVNLYNPETKFMQARISGQWYAPFDPAEVNFNYTEANSWQYSLYAPHAVGVMTDLLGGKDSLELWLDRLFTTASNLSGRHQVDITGLIGQYAHGNEPSHHLAYLYNYTNSPEKTQLYTDSILYTMYKNDPDGLSGNEDCGQMSSWYVLSAMGIYQIAPGSMYYDISRPIMNEAIIKLNNNNQFIIKTLNNSRENKYIQSITLNGTPIYRHYIHYSEFKSGAELVITMGPEPLLDRDKYTCAPTLSSLPESFVPVPYFEQTDRIFIENMEVSLHSIFPGRYTIYYTTDESDPMNSSTAKKYKKSFYIDETTTVKAYAINQFGKSSTISNTFVQKDENVSITIKSEYDNQYAASGDFTLIDGIKGKNEFRTGNWQGYWAQDVVAEITFKEAVVLSEIGIGVLSDMKSWIFIPSSVEFEISYDGVNFEALSTIHLESMEEKDMYPNRRDLVQQTNSSTPIKAIRIVAKTYGKCPEWHLGNGNDTWLFVDEIFFK